MLLREKGYYWVKLRGHGWGIGFFNKTAWWCIPNSAYPSGGPLKDSDLEEIKDTMLEPAE